MIKNRNGWIRIVEAFTAVMLLAGVLLVIISNSRANVYDFSNQIYDSEAGILMKIYTDDLLRDEILNEVSIPDGDLPVRWGDFDTKLPGVKDKIYLEIPGNLDCMAKLCLITDSCALDADPSLKEKSIYAMSAIVTASINNYKPRKLNLFCWEK